MNASNVNKSGNPGKPRPPGQGLSKSARQRRNRRLANQTASAALPGNTTLSLSDLSRIVNSVSSVGSRPPRNRGRAPNGGTGKKSGNSGVRGGFMAGKDSSNDAARYLAAVFDPMTAPEGAKVVHGVVSTYPTTAVKHTFTGTVTANTSGNLQVIGLPGNANNDYKFLYFNGNDLLEPTWLQAADYTPSTLGTDRIASNMMAKRRQVAFSLCLEFIGAADTAAGSAFSTFMPTPYVSAKQAYTPGQLAEQYFNRISTVKAGERLEVIWLPREDKDLDFIATDTGNVNGYPVITIVGGKASGVYRWTITSHEEYIPSLINHISSASIVSMDNNVSSILHNTVKENQSYFVSRGSDQSLSTSVYDFVVEKGTEYGGKALEKGLEALLESFVSML